MVSTLVWLFNFLFYLETQEIKQRINLYLQYIKVTATLAKYYSGPLVKKNLFFYYSNCFHPIALSHKIMVVDANAH